MDKRNELRKLQRGSESYEVGDVAPVSQGFRDTIVRMVGLVLDRPFAVIVFMRAYMMRLVLVLVGHSMPDVDTRQGDSHRQSGEYWKQRRSGRT